VNHILYWAARVGFEVTSCLLFFVAGVVLGGVLL